MPLRWVLAVTAVCVLVAGCKQEPGHQELLRIQKQRHLASAECLPAMRLLQKELKARKQLGEKLDRLAIEGLEVYQNLSLRCPEPELFPGKYEIAVRVQFVADTPLACYLLLNQWYGLEDSCSPREIPEKDPDS